jgi:hypothetical protein
LTGAGLSLDQWYIKDPVYVPPLATSLSEFDGRITAAVTIVNLDLLNHMQTESDYRYICWVTDGALIKHL